MSRYVIIGVLLQCVFYSFILAADSSAQNKSIKDIYVNVELSADVDSFFREIEKSTGLQFSYNKTRLDLHKQVSVNMINQSLAEVLTAVSKQTHFSFKRINNVIFVSAPKSAELVVPVEEAILAIHITGKVIAAENSEPLPGVSVVVKGTTIGTITDSNGNYAIDVPGVESILVFSFIGYAFEERIVGEQSVIDVDLTPDITSLDEIVVTGYSEKSKATLTSAVSTVNGRELARNPAPNLTSSLAGKLPGVIANVRSGQPGSDDAVFYVRGKGTLGNSEALIIIDGIPNRGTFSRLSSNDIESITVLKDASAAIYGARAANGVILITTKRGKQGKTTFTYNANYGVSGVTRYPDLTNSYQNSVYTDEINARYGAPLQWTDEERQHFLTGDDPLNYPNTDWYDVVVKDWSPQTHHNLSASGGSENISYYVSGDYLYQDGIYRYNGADYRQFQIRSNIDARLNKIFKLGVDISLRQENRHSTSLSQGSIWWEMLKAYPYIHDFYPTNGLPGPGIAWGNNLAIITSPDAGFNDSKNRVVNSKFTFDLDLTKLTKGLSLGGWAAFDFSNLNGKEFHNQWTVYDYDKYTEEYIPIKGGDRQSREMTQYTNVYNAETFLLKLNYDRYFEKHHFSGFVAAEQNQTNFENVNAYRRDYLSDKLLTLDAGGKNQKDNSGGITKTARVNYFSNISYDYAGKYIIDFILRRDGSQNFPEETRFGWFPGVSVGWRLTEENFMSATSGWLNNLKLRASWSRTGNDLVPPFQYVTKYQLDAGYYFGEDASAVPGLSVAGVPNPNITWEKSTTVNVGLESRFLNDHLTFEADFFSSDREDILIRRNASVPAYTGLALPDENFGKVNNKGMEFLVGYNNKIGGLTYNVSGNLTYARNTVKFFDEPLGVPEHQKRTGHPMDSWLLYQANGLYQTQEEIDNSAHLFNTKPGDIRYDDINGDGKITSLDQIRVFDSPTPRIVYGFNAGVEIKGIELNLFFQGQSKAKQVFRPWGLSMPVEYYEGRWTESNPNAEYPRAFGGGDTFNSRYSTFWLKDVSFLRLKTMELAYNFPGAMLSPIGVQQLRVYFSGTNLLTFDKLKIYDPESTSDYGTYYPQQRILNVGLQVSF